MLNEYLRVAAASLLSIAVMFILTKLMGKRQLSQLSMFDYINGITLGSIAAELTLAEPDKWYRPLTAMVIYAVVTIIIAVASNKSLWARKLFVGKPIVLFDSGVLYERNLMRAKLDVNEFLTNCRYAGYFDLADVQTAVLETNGNISILPKSTARPANPEDMKLNVPEDKVVTNVIIDGHILDRCLKRTGNDDTWLYNRLKSQNVRLEDVILATCDSDNKLTVYEKTGETESRDIFL